MIYSIYLFLLITWMVNQLAIEFYDGNFKKVLTWNWWKQKTICPKCTAFWITLVFTQNFIVAATVSLLLHILTSLTETKDNSISL